MLSTGILITVLAFAATGISTGLLIRFLVWRKILDHPNARSSHTAPTPRGGGIAILVGLAVAAAAGYQFGLPLASLPILGGTLLVALGGAIDDSLRGIPPFVRLAIQTGAAGWVVWSSGGFRVFPLPSPLDAELAFWGGPLAVVWIVAVSNFYNFLDGIDGYAAAQGLLAGAGFLLLGYDALAAGGFALVGACAAFLLYNWHPAKIFMGDVGSSALGFLLAALPFSLPAGSRETAVFATGIFLWFFLSDGLFTLLARLVRGEKIWTAHRSHLYQRLVITGIAHDSVVIPVGGTAVVLVCLAAFSSRYQLPVWQWFAVLLAAMTFLAYLGWTRLREAHVTASSSIRPPTRRRSPRQHYRRSLIRFGATALGGFLVLGAVATHSGSEGVANKGSEFYVSPSGRPQAAGTLTDPWDLATALAHPKAVTPGDTIWLRGGTYPGVFESTLTGEPDRPILVRQVPGERVTIDTGIASSGAGLTVDGADCWYWGIEMMSSNPKRETSQKGSDPDGLQRVSAVVARGPRTRFINMIIHDAAGGYGFWTPAEDAEIYGNLLYYNGWSAPDRGHGHGIYSQNRNGKKRIEDNIAFSNFGMGIRAYGTEKAFARNIEFVGNVAFNSGVLSGSPPERWSNFLVTVGSGAEDILFDANHSYHLPTENRGGSSLGWVFSGEEKNLVARNNYWIGGSPAIEIWNWDKVIFEGNVAHSDNELVLLLNHLGQQNRNRYHWDRNTYMGSDLLRLNGKNTRWTEWQRLTGLDAHSSYQPGRPKGTWVFLRPNKYEQGRAHLIIYNWSLLDQVAVDVSQVLPKGTKFEIRDAQNFFAKPLLAGVYEGQQILIPMKGLTAAAPVGLPPPEHTAPQFGVFVIIPHPKPSGGERVSGLNLEQRGVVR